jgi:hypothetical protein
LNFGYLCTLPPQHLMAHLHRRGSKCACP